MTDLGNDIVAIVVLLLTLGLLPFLIVMLTGFLKIAIVMFLVRNALGVQQTPPNLVLYGIALVLTVYVTAPLFVDIYGRIAAHPTPWRSADDLLAVAADVRKPVQAHLLRFTQERERQFFRSATARVWPDNAGADLKDDDIIVLMPAFVSSELTRGFEIGFLLYLPFLVIDLVVSNILMAMGMIMISPTLISVPLKLFLLVGVDGWSRLMHGLILSYATGS
jgi:type III secretion protein R